ncbi:DDT domain-containing protein [Senna tora]|uniref:DDT domain-containing protein n=1 Tax=Senna tora TaxID=362788 RepID=A0A834X8V5_9FABA|nr:DDT domain-containing protein [Senna tora]
MPLLKRKPFPLAELPKDLEPHEPVYQVRFTKEIFRDYHDYLKRINLYRQRVWMCKVTGKTSLTFEEAMVSEKRATEKVQQIPKELMAPALRIIQYSMLPLRDLANTIAENFLERLYVGAELHGKRDDGEHPCKILKVIQEGADKFRYEVAWLDKNMSTTEKTEVSAEDLVHKKQPFSRNILKSFVRESTYRNAPWVLHNELAQNYGISTDIPKELRGRAFFKNGLLICNKKRKNEDLTGRTENCKRKKSDQAKTDDSTSEKENDQCKEEPIKYPIDDLLVKPGPDDPVFTDRPSPSRDFNVPIHCVGDLLMVWDFCTSFGRLLHLTPYSLEDFENAICHKESNVVLLVESHAALFRVLMKNDGEYTSAVQKRNRKFRITMINWQEYLCDFLEMINVPGLRHYEATIKRGHYGLVDVNAKLEILRELVNRALETSIFRKKLDEVIEERQALGVTRRGEALEEGRKRREEKERLKAELDSNGSTDEHCLQIVAIDSPNNNHSIQNGDVRKKRKGEKEPPKQKDALGGSMINHSNHVSKKTLKNLSLELKEPAENGKESSRKDLQKQLKSEKDPSVKNNIEQRREYFEREMEKRFVRTSPLGKDRHYNRYWWFRRDGRIFVESSDSQEWGYYSSKEELDMLMSSLNRKGERERALQNQLEKYYSRICLELQKRSKDLIQNIALDESVLRRSTRVRAPPRENPANAFLKYVNKWKDE